MEILSPAMHVPLMQPPSTFVNLMKNPVQDKQLTEEINNTLRLLERASISNPLPGLVNFLTSENRETCLFIINSYTHFTDHTM